MDNLAFGGVMQCDTCLKMIKTGFAKNVIGSCNRLKKKRVNLAKKPEDRFMRCFTKIAFIYDSEDLCFSELIFLEGTIGSFDCIRMV